MAAEPFDFFRIPKQPNPGFGDTFVEDFTYGWSKETTFDSARDQALRMLDLAERSTTMEEQQALLGSAVVLLVVGLEAFFKLASVRSPASPTKLTSLRQSYSECLRVAKQFSGYREIDGTDRTALVRLFEVRHAIVHQDGRVNQRLQRVLGGSGSQNGRIVLAAVKIRPVIEAAEAFVESVCVCDEGLRGLA